MQLRPFKGTVKPQAFVLTVVWSYMYMYMCICIKYIYTVARVLLTYTSVA